MSIGKREAFVALTLLSIAIVVLGLLYSVGLHRHQMHQIHSGLISSSLTSRLSKVYRDLSGEFEKNRSTVVTNGRFDVLDAMKRNGHNPVAVSEVVDRSPLANTIACSDESTRQVTDDPLNRSSVDSNKSLVDNGVSNARCRMNSTPVLRVPNVVHYVFLGDDLNFTFANYLSYRSADRFIRPDQIFVHGVHTPSGKWWNRTIDEVKNIYHVKRNYSQNAPNGQRYRYPAHISDYMRAETLLSYGGIYMDADVLVVKSFDDLRQFPFVIGREADGCLCNGIMVGERGAPFLRLILEQYHSYLGPKERWGDKSVLNTDKLSKLYPHLVHIEETTLDRPNYNEMPRFYDGRYNCSQNYAVHLYIRLWPEKKRPNGVEDILTRNTTFGELARRAIFGSHEIRNISTNATSL